MNVPRQTEAEKEAETDRELIREYHPAEMFTVVNVNQFKHFVSKNFTDKILTELISLKKCVRQKLRLLQICTFLFCLFIFSFLLHFLSLSSFSE